MHIKSTHQGNCQACGRIQAIQLFEAVDSTKFLDDAKNGTIAKHGYRVKGWGFFNGVCHGSHHKPLQVERTYADQIIASLRTAADMDDQLIVRLYRSDFTPATCHTGKTLVSAPDAKGRRHRHPELVDWKDATQYQRENEVALQIRNLKADAKNARDHAKQLEDLADRLFGTAVLAIETKQPPLKIITGQVFKDLVGREWKVLTQSGARWNCKRDDGKIYKLSNYYIRRHLSRSAS